MNDDFETPRLDRAAYVFCVQKCNSVTMDSTELPSSSKRVSDGSEEPAGTHEKFDQSTEWCFSPLDIEMIDHLLTREVLCPRAPVDYATTVPTEKSPLQYEFGEHTRIRHCV